MKRKVKRFQEGGLEAEQKKRGLAASEGDKVGFFERIRMGNIDDPKSEAYKRFGAGRGQSVSQLADIPYTETDDFKNLNKAALREKSEITDRAALRKKSEVTDERDALEAAVSSLPRRAPSKTAKAPIVTKEQLEKSGLSLRDYMNKQKGLTRRNVEKERSDTATLDRSADEVRKIRAAADAKNREVQAIFDKDNESRIAQERANEVPTAANRATDKKTPSERTGSQIMADKQERAAKVMREARRAQMGLKAGGSVKVSSASKRADGIALRGKTRGRIM